MLRILVFLASPVTIAIMMIAGSAVDGEFERDIGQSPAVVAQALQNVDLVDQPHTRAKLSEADLARPPQILLQQDPDGYSWFVMSGEKSVLRMKAELKPSAGGTTTHVSTSVERGELAEAPDVPKLFSTPSEMGPLFAVAVERALGEYIPRSERSSYSLQERPFGYKEPRKRRSNVEGSFGAEAAMQ
jgi:hypothetical protein